jgi:hypothetical protein
VALPQRDIDCNSARFFLPGKLGEGKVEGTKLRRGLRRCRGRQCGGRPCDPVEVNVAEGNAAEGNITEGTTLQRATLRRATLRSCGGQFFSGRPCDLADLPTGDPAEVNVAEGNAVEG